MHAGIPFESYDPLQKLGRREGPGTCAHERHGKVMARSVLRSGDNFMALWTQVIGWIHGRGKKVGKIRTTGRDFRCLFRPAPGLDVCPRCQGTSQ